MWLVILGLAIVILILVVLRRTSTFGEDIPKIIWTYWIEEDPPEIVKKCIESWKRYNPDYDVRLLNKNTVSKWIPELNLNELKHNDSPARESDFVRLSILAVYGGFWVDASIIMTEPLYHIQTIQKEKGCEFIAYYLEGFTSRPEYPVIESWFFACVPDSSFVKKWRDEFTTLNNYNTVKDYVDAKKSSGVDFQKIDSLEYLVIHLAAQTVMQKDMGQEAVSRRLHLMKAEDGPYKFLKSGGWNSHQGLKNLCEMDDLKTPIIKLRNSERIEINNDPNLKCIYKFLN